MNGELRRRFFNDFRILEIMGTEGVIKRELVGKLAGTESVRALEVARSISEPWYRCQSLAHVAWHLEDRKQFEKVIGEALAAAYEHDEPNRVVSVASWAVRAMIKKSDRRLGSVVDELLQKIQREANPVRQADALFYLFEAVFYEPRLRDRVLDALLAACERMNSWKRPYILSDIALVFAGDDSDRAAQIVDVIGEGRWSRKTRREIAAGKWLGPHEFFPHYAKRQRREI
jgi:hypothetical protein